MTDNTADESTNATLEDRIIAALRTVYDPEIPVNIHELGLIYDLNIDDAGKVEIKMTLTSPACPVAGALVGQVETKARAVEGVTDAKVDLVWDPPWTPARMSDAAKLTLNLDIDDPAPSRPGGPKTYGLGRIP